jgi:ribonuclease Y
MEINLLFLVVALLFLGVGAIVGYYTRQSIASKQLTTAEGKATSIIEEAKQKYKEETLNAKNKAVEILEEAKKREKEREEQIRRMEQRLEKREEMVDGKMDELDKGKSVLEKKAQEVRAIKKEAEAIRQKELDRLEKIASLNKEQAKKILLQLTEDEYKEALL